MGALCTNSQSVQCASLKSNMGHMEPSAAAAGLASLVFVPLCTCSLAMNAQLRLSDAPWKRTAPTSRVVG